MATYTSDQIFNPEKYGLEMCPHCNGYGSSLKDPVGVDTCTKCGGSGLQPKYNEHDVVALKVTGQVGAIVHIHNNREAFEVEFPNGVITVTPTEIASYPADVFEMSDQPETCRKCGRRTDFQQVTSKEQVHTCPECGYIYKLTQ